MGLVLQPLHMGAFDDYLDCAACGGTGLVSGVRCTPCRGAGVVSDGFTREVIAALAAHAPPGLDFMRVRDEREQWTEVLRDGSYQAPRRIQVLSATPEDDGTMSVDEFLQGASSAQWTVGGDGDDERWPELPPLILPRAETKWDLTELQRDPVIARLSRMHGVSRIGELSDEIDWWQDRCGDAGRYVLEGALVQRIVMTFG